MIVAVWFPEIGSHHEYFEIEYEWEEYPEQGNNWDDPGHGGAISISSIVWLNGVNTNFGGITVHKSFWDMKWYGDKKTLAERLEYEAIVDAQTDFYDDYQDDDYL